MPFNFEEGEVILVNKPYRWTSFDVVNFVRNYVKNQPGLRKIKIGHAGTLDPLATGLLILCTGKMTKQIEQFKEFDKEYTGTFTLGATTPSFDMETDVNDTFPVDHVNEGSILAACLELTGNYDQLPPAFSAVKVKGVRAYEYARKDQEVRISPRPVSITEFEVTNIQLPVVSFRISCSKGTYIRAVARDLGEKLKCGAYLSSLCRTRIGGYHLKDAYGIEVLKIQLQG